MSAKFATPVLAASMLLGSLGIAQSAHASNPAGQACVFDKYAPIAVAPYITENSIDYGSYSFLGGAQLFVPAREGLTREWLAASVQQALASSQSAPGASSPDAPANSCDSPHFKDVQVTVVSGGNGFWVQLIGKDSHTSEALLKWARSVVDEHKTPQTFRSASGS